MTNTVKKELKPNDGIMVQHALKETRNGADIGPAELFLSLKYKIDKVCGHLMVVHDATDDTDLTMILKKSAVIEVVLSDDQPWQWSKDYLAITRKNKTHLYQNLRYIDHAGKQSAWKKGLSGVFKRVRFEAKYAQEPSTAHGFCLNVDFEIPGTTKVMLPVSIDPEVINPQPPENFLRDLLVEGFEGSAQPLFALGSTFGETNKDESEPAA